MQESLSHLFRLSEEPRKHWDDWRVHEALTRDPKGYFEYAKGVFNGLGKGHLELDLPAKLLFTDPPPYGADFRVMPCVIRNGNTALKTVKIVGTNLQQQIVPGQITVGQAFALHPVENFITHVFDACLLSSARTGLCAALSMDRLASQRRYVHIIGCGRVGYYTAYFLDALGGVERITFADADQDRARMMVQEISRSLPHIDSSAVRLTDRTPENVDVLVLATPSREPILRRVGAEPQLVISLGADAADQHELDPAWQKGSDLFVDTLDSLNYGDLLFWNGFEEDVSARVTPLVKLFPNRPEQEDCSTRLFISTGSALMDNVTIGYLLGVSLGNFDHFQHID